MLLKFIYVFIKKRWHRLKYEWSLFKISKRGNVIFENNVEIRAIENLSIGPNTTIGSNALLHCGGQPWCNYKGHITIGERGYIGPHSVLFGAGGIEIGKDVVMGPGVTIVSHEHSYQNISKVIQDQAIEFGKIIIEDDVWIGSQAVILPDIKIGKGSVIGAGAVVTKDIPSFSVAVGVPARIIKSRSLVYSVD